jgi:hypothetical protein
MDMTEYFLSVDSRNYPVLEEKVTWEAFDQRTDVI